MFFEDTKIPAVDFRKKMLIMTVSGALNIG